MILHSELLVFPKEHYVLVFLHWRLPDMKMATLISWPKLMDMRSLSEFMLEIRISLDRRQADPDLGVGFVLYQIHNRDRRTDGQICNRTEQYARELAVSLCSEL